MPSEFTRRSGDHLTWKQVVAIVTVVSTTVGLLGWLNVNYVTATDFNSFKNTIELRITRSELQNRKLQLEVRNDSLEDKIFELSTREQTKGKLSLEDSTVLERYKREINKNANELNSLDSNLTAMDRRLGR